MNSNVVIKVNHHLLTSISFAFPDRPDRAPASMIDQCSIESLLGCNTRFELIYGTNVILRVFIARQNISRYQEKQDSDLDVTNISFLSTECTSIGSDIGVRSLIGVEDMRVLGSICCRENITYSIDIRQVRFS
jgi:hypothetical protein